MTTVEWMDVADVVRIPYYYNRRNQFCMYKYIRPAYNLFSEERLRWTLINDL